MKTHTQTALLFTSALFLITVGCSGKQTESETEKKYTCTFSIECSAAMEENASLSKEKLGILPPDGVIFPETQVQFSEGETAYDVLERVCKENKIQMESEWSSAFGSQYIEGIANLYETDCDSMSGWTFYINGGFSDYGCSQTVLSDGDKVEWTYVLYDDNFSDDETDAD